MSGVSETIEQGAPAVVPPLVERTRRIARLAGSAPYLVFFWAWCGLRPAQTLLGFGDDTYLILTGLCVVGGVAALAIRRYGRFAGMERATRRSALKGVRGMALFVPITVAVMVAGVAMIGLAQPYLHQLGDRGRMALLLVPFGALLAYAAKDDRWWPRVALLAAYGCASGLLLLWPPAPGKCMAVAWLVFIAGCVLCDVIDQCELYKLLGETDGAGAETGVPERVQAEADGDTV